LAAGTSTFYCNFGDSRKVCFPFHAERMQEDPEDVRIGYERLGVAGFYARHAKDYRNPHEDAIRLVLTRVVREWSLDLSNVLDLAAGSGEITLALREMTGAKTGAIHGIDPLTHAAYETRTGQKAGRESFEEIAAGALRGQRFSLIVCSFAMHLLEPSRLPMLAMELSRLSSALLILTPHKRPQIKEDWGWKLDQEQVQQRIRARLYTAHPARIEASCLDRD
jgi:hypothetical protein